MKNIRLQNVTAKRIHTPAGTPVKIASSGSACSRKNGIELRGLIRPCGSRSPSMTAEGSRSVEMVVTFRTGGD